MKYTVFFDQVNRVNFQLTATDEDKAIAKAARIYRKRFELPSCDIEENWLVEADGEDKGD